MERRQSAFDSVERVFYAAAILDLEGARDFEFEVVAGGHLISDFGRGYPPRDAGGVQIVYNPARDEHVVVYSGNDEPYTLAQPAVSKVFARRLGHEKPPAAVADRRAPLVTLLLRRLQRIVRQRGLVFRAGCDEACRITGSARIQVPGASGSLKLGGASRPVRAGVRAKLKLKASRRVLRILRRAFIQRNRLTARLSVTGVDGAGNQRTMKRKVRTRR